MWLAICKFEILYKLRRPETYVYFVFLLAVSVFAFDFIYQGKEMGPLHSSSPQVIGKIMAVLSGFFMIINSMIMGVPVLKDYGHKMESLIFVSPIQKWEYLLGRYLGSFVVLFAVYFAILLGMMIGDWMPWREAGTIGENYLLNYLHTYAIVVLPVLFFGGSIFFVTGMLSRKMIVVYTQGLVFFLILLISVKIENPLVSGVMDPFSHMAIGQLMSAVSLEEAANQLIPIRGVLLYNRVFWCGLGIAALLYGYFTFSFGVDFNQKRKTVPSYDRVVEAPSSGSAKLSPGFTSYGLRTSAAQLVAHSFFYFYTILRKPSFWAIVICGIVTILVNSVNLGLTYGVPSFPVTYLLLDELKEMSIFFFFILLGLFTSDVIWRERRYGVDQVVDALPVSDLVMVGGKFFGLVATYLVLLVSMLIFGMILQIASGFYDFQFATYLLGLGELWLMLMLFTFISFFFQVVSNSQFIGHVLLVVFFIFVGLLGLKGFNHGLYDFGGPGLSDYSELNGFGHSFYPFVFFKSYWISFCIGVLAITAALNPRGLNVSLKARVLAMSYRLTPAVKGVLGFASFSMLLLGVFIFYNTNVLNEYYSNSSKVELRAEYEKVLKHLQYIPQPKITDVSLTLDIFPEALGFELGGKYVLKNLDSVLIEAIHVQTFVDAVDTLKGISFNRNALVSESYDQFGYRIYQLEQPLAPGDSLEMSFSQALSPKGFAPNHRSSAVVYNGSLIDNDKFPSIGYCNQIELEEQSIRADYGLDSVVQKEDRGHPFESHYGRDGGDGSSIDFKITVSTSVDQVAVAPGALKRDWIDGERRFFEYQMDAPMINFYAITSARYAVKKRQWSASKLSDSEPVDLAVYYHPSHAYNVDRMMDGLSAGLTYCTEAFGPYPYGSLKVVEVPRDADRAQSFPTLITYSESMGFIMDVDSTVDLNIPFFITAHEVAHQWWGMQLVAANVKGKHFLLESLSHYSALMTYQATYGAEETRRLVDFERGRYVAGNQEDLTPEVALIDVTDQEYLYYSKASVLLYEFQEKIGEEALNGALQAFICDWNAAKRIQARKRFAYSVDLLPYLKANAPVRMQEEIVEMFEEVSEMTLD